MQVFVAALVCICCCAFYLPVAKQDVIDQHGAQVEWYNGTVIGAVIYLRCSESFFWPSLCLSFPLIPDGIRGPAKAFPHAPTEASPCEPQPWSPGQTIKWIQGVAGDDAPCGRPQACGQGHRHSSSQSTQVRNPQHTRVKGYFQVIHKAVVPSVIIWPPL